MVPVMWSIYHPIHIGHEQELQHIHLNTAERKRIANDIANQVPFSDILNKIRDTVSNNSLDRIHLLNMQDLENIERSFNLNPVKRHANDGTSVESWVKEMQSSSDPCVL
ncbi:hypothetical protein WDU94_003593 [Cyamophila willieti]